MKQKLRRIDEKDLRLNEKLDNLNFWTRFSLEQDMQAEILNFLDELKKTFFKIRNSTDKTMAKYILQIYRQWWNVLRSVVPDIAIREKVQDILRLENLLNLGYIPKSSTNKKLKKPPIRFKTPNDVRSYLEEIDERLITNGKIRDAKKQLREVEKADVVKRNIDLRKTISDLMRYCEKLNRQTELFKLSY